MASVAQQSKSKASKEKQKEKEVQEVAVVEETENFGPQPIQKLEASKINY